MWNRLALSGDPERDDLVREIFDLHGRIRAKALELVGPAPLPPDLTMQQLRVLLAIARQEGLPVHRLGQQLGVSAPTASGLVDRLAEKGLVARVDDPDDRRVRHLRLTPAGATLLEGLDSMFERLMREVVSLLSLEELVALRGNALLMIDVIGRAQAGQPRPEEPPRTN